MITVALAVIGVTQLRTRTATLRGLGEGRLPAPVATSEGLELKRNVERSSDWGTKEARLVHPLPPSATAGGEEGREASDVSHTLSGDGSGRSGGLIDGETWSMKARTRGGVPGALPRGRCDMVAVGPVRRGMKSSDRAPKLPQ